MRIVLATLVLAMVAAAETSAGAAMFRKVCRSSCQSAIASCMTGGGRRAACRRQVVQRCRREGQSACAFSASTTSTTLPYPTTLGGVGADVTVHDVRTVFEIDWSVPAPGAEYALVDVTIENRSSYGFTPFGFQLQSGGLGFAQSYLVVPGSAFPNCTAAVAILPGGSLACTLVFEITEGATTGQLAFGAPYSYPASGATALTGEFSIPVVVRPTATLDVLAAAITAGPQYCSARSGFALLQVTFAYTSHDGATGLDLSPYQFLLEAGGAIYDPDGCSYSLPDYCDGAIGVPVDGSASCSLLFEVPAAVTAAELRALNVRYPASAAFTLD